MQRMKVGMAGTLWAVLLVLYGILFLVEGVPYSDGGLSRQKSPYILKEALRIVKTEAGRLDVITGEKNDVLAENEVGLSFVTMEPKALLLPQYIDASFVLYVQQGKVRIGWVKDDNLNQEDAETGDVFVVPGGTVFYLLNTDVGERLRIFSLFDTSHSLNKSAGFQSFYVAGGADPRTVLNGFDDEILAAAFKVPKGDVRDILSAQYRGPIVYTTRKQFEMMSQPLSWSWTNIIPDYVSDLFPRKQAAEKAYNLLKQHRGFRNKNGWSIAVDGKDYRPLKKVNAGVFAVSLKPGSMLAPHWNSEATEIAVVTNGTGTVQITFPNGTNAMSAEVEEGTAFVVPKYFPMCQIASRDGHFDFVGFTTSAHRSRPQFLAGSNSVLRALDEETRSIAFDIPSDRLNAILDAQNDLVILPGDVEPPPRDVA